MEVREAVASRRSIRGFLDRDVDPALLRRVLEAAQRTPSGGNLQPWHAVVLTGAALEDLRARMRERLASGFLPEQEYAVYPPSLHSPYRERRFRCGEMLYELAGIPREDRTARLLRFARNWDFFGAPVGLILLVDRRMGPPQWADLGMWLQTVMLLLREAGLDSCAQEAWSAHHDVVVEALAPPPELMVFCGLAIGYADPDEPTNALVTERAPLQEAVTFLDAPI